jgi:peptidoglycan-N-acetylglucosamine deacetylase
MADTTVCLTFEFDAYALWMAMGARGARLLSRGEFDATHGTPRVLELLDRLHLPSTWFIPGHTAETFPQLAAQVAAHGHELANHGYLHEDFGTLSHDQVRSVIRRGSEALERLTGTKPTGIKAPTGDFDSSLFPLFVEEGFRWDGTLIGEHPCWCRANAVIRDDGGNQPGECIDLVEVPCNLIMSAFPYFEFSYGKPELPGLSNPRRVLNIWKSQFDFMAEHVPNAVVVHSLHPQTIGWGGRMIILEQFIEYCLAGEGNVRFATVGQVAEEFRSTTPQPL